MSSVTKKIVLAAAGFAVMVVPAAAAAMPFRGPGSLIWFLRIGCGWFGLW